MDKYQTQKTKSGLKVLVVKRPKKSQNDSSSVCSWYWK